MLDKKISVILVVYVFVPKSQKIFWAITSPKYDPLAQGFGQKNTLLGGVKFSGHLVLYRFNAEERVLSWAVKIDPRGGDVWGAQCIPPPFAESQNWEFSSDAVHFLH